VRVVSAILLFTLSCPFSFLTAQWYYWPLYPVSERECNSTFCEYRSGHLHEGIDIPAEGSGYTLNATTDTFKYIGREHRSYGWIVTVQHYTQSDGNKQMLEEGSRYIHMDEVEPLLVETVYIDQPIAKDITFYENHLHFEVGRPAPTGVVNNIFNAFNPLSIDDNLCPEDATEPTLLALYVDGDPGHQGNAEIACWNFLNYTFDQYYDASAAPPFVKLKLPAETKNEDLDDPHILISGNCRVRFILDAYDVVNVAGSRCAPYEIIALLDWSIILDDDPEYASWVDTLNRSYVLRFNFLDNIRYYSTPDKHEEEDVYHTESPLESHIGAPETKFYYRLYEHDGNNNSHYPVCLTREGIRWLKTEDFEEGHHRLRVVVKDYTGNDKTADIHFYIRRSEFVDYGRAFQD